MRSFVADLLSGSYQFYYPDFRQFVGFLSMVPLALHATDLNKWMTFFSFPVWAMFCVLIVGSYYFGIGYLPLRHF